jgi:hypothetical protein
LPLLLLGGGGYTIRNVARFAMLNFLLEKKYNTKDICDANIVKILVKINRSFFDTQFFYIIYGSLYQIEKVEFLLSDSLIFSDAGLMKHPLL